MPESKPPYPPYREPGDRPREYLIEVAAAATADSWPLVGDRGLVEDVCRELAAPDPLAALLDTFRAFGADSVSVMRSSAERLMVNIGCTSDDRAASIARLVGAGPLRSVAVATEQHEWMQADRIEADLSVYVSGPVRAVVATTEERAA